MDTVTEEAVGEEEMADEEGVIVEPNEETPPEPEMSVGSAGGVELGRGGGGVLGKAGGRGEERRGEVDLARVGGEGEES